MATHSSILAWAIPWTEEPVKLQSLGLQKVRQNWAGSRTRPYERGTTVICILQIRELRPRLCLTHIFVIWFVMFTNNMLPLLLKSMLNEGACLTFQYTLNMMKCQCFWGVKTNDIMSAFRSSTICKVIAFVFCQALHGTCNRGTIALCIQSAPDSKSFQHSLALACHCFTGFACFCRAEKGSLGVELKTCG